MADSGRDVKMTHLICWKNEEGGVRQSYTACGAPMTQDTQGYEFYTAYVTCAECKLWVVVNQMAR